MLTKIEAVARLERIVSASAIDLDIGLRLKASLEAANNIVIKLDDAQLPGARTYDTILRAEVVALASAVMRMFDQDGQHRDPNRSDKASIPQLIRLLKQKRCQKELKKRARVWSLEASHYADTYERDCGNAMDEAIEAFNHLRRSASRRKALLRLRDLRDRAIAHTLTRVAKEKNPAFAELFDALETARLIVEKARFAIEGVYHDTAEHERLYHEDADRFWRMAFLDEQS